MVDFSYNVIVVDNYSTDGTSRVIEDFKDDHIVHLVPSRKDLAIGGCWNEAIYSTHCGRFAVQLDSDDMFMNNSVLHSMVRYMETECYAMVVGSYKTVDFDLNEISPGIVDHKEWTPENGHNNALRINGFGAPRAYDVTVLRKFGFPNVSYGEDYAVGLRMCREYEIGRIYEPLYLCRRWIGNSDRTLPLETLNRFNEYKDEVRTSEIEARILLNRGENHLFCPNS
jgi:glycosyltransferase involved in cell wall biosynthesis